VRSRYKDSYWLIRMSLMNCSRYADHVGIHYVLCTKLRQFPYEDIEFFLPQLCHLIISVDNESMALEEFLLDLCEESVTAALLVRSCVPKIRNHETCLQRTEC
jgi:phosphatidylinositol 4-kinase